MTEQRPSIRERLYAFWRRPERDVADELRFHLEMRVDEAKRLGMNEEEARAAALARFGTYNEVQGELMQIDTARERRHDRREWFDDVRRDVVFATRALRRSPAFALASLATLAVAIGAN